MTVLTSFFIKATYQAVLPPKVDGRVSIEDKCPCHSLLLTGTGWGSTSPEKVLGLKKTLSVMSCGRTGQGLCLMKGPDDILDIRESTMVCVVRQRTELLFLRNEQDF